MLQLQEMILALLCVVALMILLWDLALQMRLKRLEKKIKDLEERKALEEKKASEEKKGQMK